MVLSKLKEARLSNGYTYEKVANIIGISKTYYWQIENGQRNLSYNLAIKIAKVFKMKPDDLFYK